MRINTKQTRYLGIALIVLGLFAIFRLWWLALPLTLVAAGGYMYLQRRDMGRTNEAVQFGLWGVGSGLLMLIHFFFPGVLLLAGASLLARGREGDIDQRVQRFLTQVRSRRSGSSSSAPTSAQNLPVHMPPETPSTTSETQDDSATTGKTIRL